MIIVAGEIDLHPDDVEAARPAAIAMMDETAKEAGCIHYRFYQDLEVPGRLHVYEEWDSEAALAAHITSPHMAVWRAALSELRVLSRDIKKIEAGAVEKLG